MSHHSLSVTAVLGVVVLVGCVQKAPPAAEKASRADADVSSAEADAAARKQARETHEKAVKALEALKVDIRQNFTGVGHFLQLDAKELKEDGTFKPEVLEQLKKLTEPLDLRIFGAPISDAGLAQLKDIPALRRLLLNKTAKVTDAGLDNVAGCAGLTDIALVEVKVTDAGFAALAKMNRLKYVHVVKVPLSDKGLEHLKSLEELETLHVDGADNISAAGLAHLKKLPRLKELTLQGFKKDSKLNDAALKEVGEMVTLEKLIFGVELPIGYSPHVTSFGDEGVAHLGRLKNLKLLNIAGCERVTDTGLASLKGLTNLETLLIAFTKISDNGLANLKEMTKLKSLTLNGLTLTEKGLAHLSGLSKLEWLDLRETFDGVNDAAIQRLKGLSSLRDLILYDTGVTKKGADELKKALPQLSISMR
jgi:hypothetical protein